MSPSSRLLNVNIKNRDQEHLNLSRICLKFSFHVEYIALCLLNEWRAIPQISRSSLSLYSWRRSLYNELPTLEFPWVIQRERKTKVDSGFAQHLHAIFESLEKVVPDSVAGI